LEKALRRSVTAIDDWLHLFIPEEFGDGYGPECVAGRCDCKIKDYVAETRARIKESGGTLAYIADVQEQNRDALVRTGEEEHAPGKEENPTQEGRAEEGHEEEDFPTEGDSDR
jgi:hypothetical protein